MKRRNSVIRSRRVWMNCAPAAIFFASRLRGADRCDVGILGRAEQDAWGERDPATALEAMLIAHAARNLQQETESRSNTGWPADDRRPARRHPSAQHVADAHRGGAQDSPWMAMAVPVATRNLHDGCVTDPRQQRATARLDRLQGRAAAVRRIDRVDVVFEHARAGDRPLPDRRIRRRELGP